MQLEIWIRRQDLGTLILYHGLIYKVTYFQVGLGGDLDGMELIFSWVNYLIIRKGFIFEIKYLLNGDQMVFVGKLFILLTFSYPV